MKELIKITDHEYFNSDRINFSKLKNYMVSGKYYIEKKDEEVSSDSILFGTLVHGFLLEPKILENFLPCPKLDKRTKEGKEKFEALNYIAQRDMKEMVSEEIYNEAQRCASSLSPVCKELLENKSNIYENSLFWDYGDLKLKSKIDIYNPETKTLIDVKTTRDFYQFDRAIVKNKYHLQLAFYALALKYCGYDVSNWKIIAIENTPPYDSCVYNFSYNYRNYSLEQMLKFLTKFDFDYTMDSFQGLSENEEITLELPNYL